MKPRYLEFCGINSFSEPAKIDFVSLSEFGIFGIFGDTGSGKSTILDCIGFALYGSIARSRGGSIVEAVNYKCDRAYVCFEFETVYDGKRRVYRTERELRKKTGAQTVRVYERIGEDFVAVASGTRESNELLLCIIGLEQKDFEKCIALPQGEFAQFVRSAKSDRVKLIARLFDLEAYGERLSRRVNKREAELSSEIDVLEARLAPYAAFTEASVSALKEETELLAAREKTLGAELVSARELEKKLAAGVERRREAEKCRERERALLERREEMTALEGELSRLEKAAAVLETARAGKAAREQSERENALLEEAQARLVRAQAEQSALPAFDDEQAEAEIVRLTELFARAKAAEADAERHKRTLAELERVAAEYRREAQRFGGFSYETERAALEAERNALGSGDYFAYLESEGKAALLKDEYAIFAEELTGLTSRHPEIKSDSAPLIGKYRGLAEEGERAGDMRRAFEMRESRRKAAEEALHNLERLNGDYKVHCGRLQELQTRYKSLKEEADSFRLSEVSVSASDAEREVSRRRAERKEYAEKKRRADAELSEAVLAKEKAAERAKAADEALKGARERYRSACTAGKFSGVEDARALLEKYGEAESARSLLETYKNECAAVSSRLSELTAGALSVTDEAYNAAKERLSRTEAEAQETTRTLARKEDEYARAIEGHAKKTEIARDLAAVRKDRELTERLKNLFYDNKFMEFVVEECLQSVATNASERLLNLTGGHYFLRYDSGFFVGDNFNGGESRPVYTLSGGETFLVSLSLALSLSAEICARSMRPIEFFFLDEGFGTLDGQLVDTVLDSLEKLKNENFSIGIISHVEELKHRIDKKLLVKKATEKRGSQIQAE